jgi:Phage tail lysozyme
VSSRVSSEQAERDPQPDRAPQASTEALHEVDRLLTLQRTAGNRAVSRMLARRRLLQRQQDAQAPPTVTAAELDSNIDDAIRDKDWGRVALNLNGFDDTDLTSRVSSDRRLRRHRREIMEGALRTMIRWPPPQRVAGAIFVVDGAAARLGRMDYVKGAIARGDWEGAAIGLNGFNDEDIRRFLPHNEAQLNSLRAAALTAMAGWSARVTGPIDELLRDPWALRTPDERILHVMERLVDTYHYPVNGAAGLVGNLRAESGVLPSRIEGSAEATPLRAPDFSNTTRDFTPDEVMNRVQPSGGHAGTGPKLPGIGLAQWTSGTRRSGLFTFNGIGSAILFDMDAQVDYLATELGAKFGPLNHRLQNATVTLDAAADDVLDHFEIPQDPEASRPARRAGAAHAAAVYQAAHPAPPPAAAQ